MLQSVIDTQTVNWSEKRARRKKKIPSLSLVTEKTNIARTHSM